MRLPTHCPREGDIWPRSRRLACFCSCLATTRPFGPPSRADCAADQGALCSTRSLWGPVSSVHDRSLPRLQAIDHRRRGPSGDAVTARLGNLTRLTVGQVTGRGYIAHVRLGLVQSLREVQYLSHRDTHWQARARKRKRGGKSTNVPGTHGAATWSLWWCIWSS